jgi:hypothetical protein
MRTRPVLFLLLAAAMGLGDTPIAHARATKPRVIVLTDIETYQNDFAARMDWTVRPYAEANHPPVPRLGHADRFSARSGQRVDLAAEGCTDPDGDALSYEWLPYLEPSSLALSNSRTGAPLRIEDASRPAAHFAAPAVAKPETTHVILAVTDRGRPPLTRYRRVIVTVHP